MTTPNVLCVSVDSLRGDFCSFLPDASHDTTPFLRSLSEEATVYANATTPSTWTLPVHTSVFSGLYPPEHGVETGGKALGDRETFARRLADRGYDTAAFYRNSWFDTGDILRGFERRHSLGSGGEPPIQKRVADRIRSVSPRTERALSTVYQTAAQTSEAQSLYRDWRREPENGDYGDTRDRETIDRVLSAIGDVSEPFCWFVHLNDVHWKYRPPTPFHRAYTDRDLRSLVWNYVRYQERIYGTRTSRLETVAGRYSPPAAEVETIENLYRGCISYCDALLAELVSGLQAAGAWEDTILVLFGDHGDAFGEDGGVFGHHFTVHDAVTRVPLLIRDPTGRLEPGTVSDPASLVDVHDTVLSLTETSGQETSGVDLTSERRDYAYTYYDVSGDDYYREAPERGVPTADLPPPRQFAVRASPTEKLVYHPDEETYAGPSADDEALRDALHEHADTLDRTSAADAGIDDEVAQRLEQMGYLKG